MNLGLTYVVLSRVRRIQDLAFEIGNNEERFTKIEEVLLQLAI